MSHMNFWCQTTYWFLIYVITINYSSVLGLASLPSTGNTRYFVGFDLGTSGVRISIIRESKEEVFTHAIPWDTEEIGSYDDPDAWIEGIGILFKTASESGIPLEEVTSICVSGTSASCLIVDTGLPTLGRVTRSPRMYNYDVTAADETKHYGLQALQQLDQYAPEKHTTRSPTSSLAKLLAWNEQSPLKKKETLCHQADYVAMKLMLDDKSCGRMGKELESIRNSVFGNSDWQNCLKLGYDVQNLRWPEWLEQACTDAGIDPRKALPQAIVSPGEPIGTISKDTAKRYGLSESTVIVGGTTDSNAAFFAALGSASSPPTVGTAVTSLGSTLAIKQWSQTYVEDSSRGVYSHRFPSVLQSANSNTDNTDKKEEDEATWLVGGASNVGCAVLRQEQFSSEELRELSSEIDPAKDSHLSYYPLAVKKGERFPTADSSKQPILTPKPDTRGEYLHGILQGIARVERDGFRILGELGALPKQPSAVLTCGGGSKNTMWSQMRERILNQAFFGENKSDGDGVHVEKAKNTEASFGAAVLAAATFVSSNTEKAKAK